MDHQASLDRPFPEKSKTATARLAGAGHYLTKLSVSTAVLPALCAAMLTLTPVSVSAAGGNLTSGNERINFAGKLRMLSQRMAAASCNLNAGIDPEANAKIVTGAKVEFKKILAALQNGDSDLKIDSPETNDAILADIALVSQTFAPIETAIVTLTKDPGSAASMELINAENIGLLDAAKGLVGTIVDVYADPAADGALAATIDVAGRQRMLSQKMSKEACQIWSGQFGETIAALQGTMQLFETSMSELREGKNGMATPPSAEIATGLDEVSGRWDALKPMLDKAAGGEALDEAGRAELANELNATLREMNHLVGLYVVAKQKAGIVGDIGATERVNFSGKLRMLSQRVAAAACNYTAGIDSDQSLSILLSAQTEFQKITRGLEFGDADLRMVGAERRRKTLVALNALNEEWAKVSAAIDNVVQGTDVDTNITFIDQHNMEVLSRAKLLVSEISGQYSDPIAMLQADAMLVDISGRQRMLTQKMSKESCQVWSGQTASAEALKGTMQLFEASLLALRDGMPAAGVKPAPTENIKLGLEDIWQDWQVLKPELERAVSNESADAEHRSRVFADLNVMLKEMNAVVGLYTIFGKTGL